MQRAGLLNPDALPPWRIVRQGVFVSPINRAWLTRGVKRVSLKSLASTAPALWSAGSLGRVVSCGASSWAAASGRCVPSAPRCSRCLLLALRKFGAPGGGRLVIGRIPPMGLRRVSSRGVLAGCKRRVSLRAFLVWVDSERSCLRRGVLNVGGHSARPRHQLPLPPFRSRGKGAGWGLWGRGETVGALSGSPRPQVVSCCVLNGRG